jgi:hypothetical protein
MIEATVLRMLAPFLSLLEKHPPKPCKGQDRQGKACTAVVESRLGKMDRFDGRPGNVDAAIYDCDVCNAWTRSERLGLPA